jgi:hypothetical protein
MTQVSLKPNSKQKRLEATWEWEWERNENGNPYKKFQPKEGYEIVFT